MTAETIAMALPGGSRIGNGWKACCPAHDDNSPSLSISDGEHGKVLVHCHAGCPQHDVVTVLRERGLWSPSATPQTQQRGYRAKSMVPGPAHPVPDRWDPLPPDADARSAGIKYCLRGWSPIPLPRAKKTPCYQGWPNSRFTLKEVEQRFMPGDNLGIIPGTASGGLVDIDLDAPEAVALADRFLPPTDSVFGRPGKPRSHRLYRVEPVPETKQFRDPSDRSMLVELRADGGMQTVFPPSRHPSGEKIAWDRDGQPARISERDLLAAVARLAAACLVVRYGK